MIFEGLEANRSCVTLLNAQFPFSARKTPPVLISVKHFVSILFTDMGTLKDISSLI